MVPTKKSEYRITGDYRKLNLQTIPDKYAIALLTDFTEQLAGATIFSSLDLFKSYHQIEVEEEDVHETAIITPLGNFVFKRLPMGLRSAGNTFQKFMDEVFRNQSNVYVYQWFSNFLQSGRTYDTTNNSGHTLYKNAPECHN